LNASSRGKKLEKEEREGIPRFRLERSTLPMRYQCQLNKRRVALEHAKKVVDCTEKRERKKTVEKITSLENLTPGN